VHVSSVSDQGSGESNEDIVAADGSVVVVLDGVSQWHTRQSGCRHGTVWYVQRLAGRILRHAAGPVSLAEAVREAIRDVADLHRHTCDLAHPWSPAATVAVLRELGDRVEYLILADCVIVVETTDGVVALTDTRLAELLQRLRQDNSPESRAHFQDGLRRLCNRPGGYWVASADPAAAAEAVTGSMPRDTIRRAVLLSDGASCLVDDYAEATWAELLELGPERLIDEVRRCEKGDPDRVRWRRGKVHDDATAAYCAF
jgi:hypothetical protein